LTGLSHDPLRARSKAAPQAEAEEAQMTWSYDVLRDVHVCSDGRFITALALAALDPFVRDLTLEALK
jgi:hypothetical protein